MFYRRITKLRKLLRPNNCLYILISKKENIRYFTGLAPLHPTEREAYLLITPTKTILYHSPFIIPPTDPHLTTITMSLAQNMTTLLTTHVNSASIFGIEAQNFTVAEADRCQEILTQTKFEPIDDVIQNMRQVKDKQEIDYISKACSITKNVMNWIQNIITTPASQSWSEIELAHHIEQQCLEAGADAMAFPTIIAFDAHSAFPHHVSDHTKLQSTDIVLVDMGVQVSGYVSDMTRTFCRQAHPSQEFISIKTAVHEAYDAAVRRLAKSHSSGADIDHAARHVIESAGYGNQFIHTTGHGVGLEAHELPHINQINHQPLANNQAITIEPGIYLPGKFGYRHEDTFLTTTGKPLCLTG